MNRTRQQIRAGTSWLWFLLFVIPISLFLVSFAMGQYPISVGELLRTLYYHVVNPEQIQDKNMEIVLFKIRLPRVCCALLIGGGLSVAGAAYQKARQSLRRGERLTGLNMGPFRQVI